MKALWLCMAMCVPMYLFEHHLACDLVKNVEGHFKAKIDYQEGFGVMEVSISLHQTRYKGMSVIILRFAP